MTPLVVKLGTISFFVLYIWDKTQYFKDIAFRLIMVSKGDCQVKRAGKIKGAKNSAAIYG